MYTHFFVPFFRTFIGTENPKVNKKKHKMCTALKREIIKIIDFFGFIRNFFLDFLVSFVKIIESSHTWNYDEIILYDDGDSFYQKLLPPLLSVSVM